MKENVKNIVKVYSIHLVGVFGLLFDPKNWNIGVLHQISEHHIADYCTLFL
jgi:hypothetical protein